MPKEILEKHSKIELCMDTMYINGVGLMTAIDRTIKYWSVECIESKKPQEHLRALSAIVSRYNKAGYYVHMVYCDREFKPIFKDAWDQLELTINYANTYDHVAEAEHNNWFLKERFQTKFHYLTDEAIPRLMIKGLAIKVAKEANFFPVKNGVSSILSPRQLIELRNLEFTKDLCIPFGSYVEAAEKTTNTP